MSEQGASGGKRITRKQVEQNPELQKEVDNFNEVLRRTTLGGYSGSDTSSDSSSVLNSTFLSNSALEDSLGANETIIEANQEVEEGGDRQVDEKRITVENQISRTNNEMAGVVTLKDAVKAVPEFDGYNIAVADFVAGCEDAKDMVEAAAVPNLIKLIKTKVTGEAKKALDGQAYTTVESLGDFLKETFGKTKTVNQLHGELGNEFQREGESVIRFANRIKQIGKRILEAKRASGAEVTAAFRATVESSIIECFKKGLLPEIEIKMETADAIADIVKNAIKAENALEAQRELRGKSLALNRKEVRKSIYFCQICKKEGHEADRCISLIRGQPECQLCKRSGHTAESCFIKKGSNDFRCRICNRIGHYARQCREQMRSERCQLCDRPGHTARQCRGQTALMVCQHCDKPGHTINNCYRVNRQANAVESRAQLQCSLCKRSGHMAATCRVKPAQNFERSNRTCNYCGKPGHFIAECRARQYSNREAGNARGFQKPSATMETQTSQQRQMKDKEADNLLCELLPLE